MRQSIFSILKTNRVVFQRVWHALAILLVLVSNFGTLAAPANASSLDGKSSAINSYEILLDNTKGYSAPVFSHPEARIANHPDQPERAFGAKLSTEPPSLTSWGISFDNITYYAYFTNNSYYNCQQVNARTVTCKGNYGLVGTKPWDGGLYLDLKARMSYNPPSDPPNDDPVRFYYSFQGEQTDGNPISELNKFVANPLWGSALPYDKTTSGFLDTNIPIAPNNYADWHIKLDTPKPGYYWAGFFSLTVSLDPIVLEESTYCPTCGAYSASQKYIANSINTRIGSFFHPVDGLSLNTADGPLSFQPTYVSATTEKYTGILGFGWTHSQDIRLVFPTNPAGRPGYLSFKDHSGNMYLFMDHQDDTYTPYPGLNATLVKNSGQTTTYTLTDSAQNLYTFDANGRLTNWSNTNGQSLIYSYGTNDKLERVTSAHDNRYLEFIYNTDGTLAQVSDFTGRNVVLAYDSAGDMVSSGDVLGKSWSYEYDTNHKLTRVVDPDGKTKVRNEYYTEGDYQGRIKKQYDGNGDIVTELVYHPDGTVTSTNALGEAETYTYDSAGVLTEEQNGAGATTVKTYDTNFRPITITDPAGDVTQLSWSADGANLTSITDAADHQTSITYDSLNNPLSVVDAGNHLTTYEYAGKLLTGTTDALNGETSYTYTPEGYLASTIDPLGRTTSYTYDVHGQRTSMTNPSGTWTYTYDDLGRLTDTTDSLGRISHSEFDTAGRLEKTVRNYDPSRLQNAENLYNITTAYEYDVRGNQLAVTDTYNHTTHYEYDDAGQLVKTIDPVGHETTNTYDDAGQLVSTTDALERTTHYEYDPAGRQVAVIDPAGNTTRTVYNPDGTVASIKDALLNVTAYTYDPLKRVIAVTDAQEHVARTTYDPMGNIVATRDALEKVTTYEYDALGRQTKAIDPLMNEIETFYDAVGNRLQTIDARGKATTYGYDSAGRLLTVTDALGNVSRTEYDALGRRTASVDAAGNRTIYTYDALDRVISVAAPLGRTSTTTYDALGNVLSSTAPGGSTTTFAYDNLYRQVAQTDALGATTSFEYDAVGNRVSVTAPNNGVTTTVYNLINQQVQMIDPLGNITTSVYDAVGQVRSITNAQSQTTSFIYDSLGRQTSVTDPLGNTTHSAYNDAGRLVAATAANDVVTAYEYDDLGRLRAVIENYLPGVGADNQTNVRTEYSYDENGNRLSIKDGNLHTTLFVYDELNRLVSETDPVGNTWHYTYDALGNRTRMIDAKGTITNYTYNAAQQLATLDLPGTDSDVTYTYDSAGRRTQMADGIGTTTWQYDPLSRPTGITDPFGKTVGYNYDSVGNRTGLTYSDNKSVSYTYDVANHLTLVKDWNNQSTQYTYDPVGRLLGVLRPNGVDSPFSYNDAGQLTQLQHAVQTNPLSTFQYTYDEVGNRKQAIERVQLPEIIISGNAGVGGATLTYTGGSTTTDGSGAYSFSVPSGWSGTVTPSKSGYTFSPSNRSYTNVTSNKMGETYVAYAHPGAFSKTGPTSGGTIKSPILTLSWSASSNAASYKYCYSTATTCEPGIDVGTATSVTLYPLSSGTYYWQVKAVNNNGGGTYADNGAMGSFIVTLPPPGTHSQTQIAVFRPANGTWYVMKQSSVSYGIPGDIPVPGDYNGDGIIDIAVYRPSQGTWYVKDIGYWGYGIPGDIPVPGDYNGDGKTDIAVYRPSQGTWYVKDIGFWTYGIPGDIPVPANYDGDGLMTGKPKTDIAVYRPTTGTWYVKDIGFWTYGMTGDIPVPGDYNGDGAADIAIFRPSNGLWAIKDIGYVSWGGLGDIPVPGDYNGDGFTDIAVWRPSEGNWYVKGQFTQQWGGMGDIPVPFGTGMSGTHQTWAPSASPEVTTSRQVDGQVASSTGGGGTVDTGTPASTEIPTEILMPSAFQTGGLKMASLAWHPMNYFIAPQKVSQPPAVNETLASTVTAAPALAQAASGNEVTIDYEYDPLNRLTKATYSNGITYEYAYDAVGNRTSQTITVDGTPSTVLYIYNDANRLISVGGVTYTYDENGNLTNDGVNTYAYDSANRLTSVVGSSSSVSYRYNGLGDRLQETVNGVTTTFTMDLNSDLSQVLSDGTNDYLYGNGRIAQVPLIPDTATPEYFLTDALGSVRQLTDATGAVTLARSYDPYGVVSPASVTSTSRYGFTGEQQDESAGLVYLRARYYAPSLGRFISSDTWDGDANKPMSYNLWLYGYGDPVNSIDPFGEFPVDSCVVNDPLCIIKEIGGISSAYITFVQSFVSECEPDNKDNPIRVNLSAYFAPVSGGGKDFDGEPVLKYIEKRGGKGIKHYYTPSLGTTTSRKQALKTSGTLLYNPTVGICMQGTGKIDITPGPIYVYCLGGLSNPKDETLFSASWGLYPPVEAFETAARAKSNSIFLDGQRLKIPILKDIFKQCGQPSHDDTIKVVSVGGGLASNTLDLFIGFGNLSGPLMNCYNLIRKVDDTSAYIVR